jgi:hypothetical protein
MRPRARATGRARGDWLPEGPPFTDRADHRPRHAQTAPFTDRGPPAYETEEPRLGAPAGVRLLGQRWLERPVLPWRALRHMRGCPCIALRRLLRERESAVTVDNFLLPRRS